MDASTIFCQLKNKTTLYVWTYKDIVAGSQNYRKLKFTFPDVWDGLTKTAYLVKHDLLGVILTDHVTLDNNDECNVPDALIANPGTLIISVEGRNTDDVILIASTSVEMEIKPTTYEAGTPPPVSAQTQARIDKRAAALAMAVTFDAAQNGSQVYIPADCNPLPWADEEAADVSAVRDRPLGDTLEIQP